MSAQMSASSRSACDGEKMAARAGRLGFRSMLSMRRTMPDKREVPAMSEPTLEVPAELGALPEKTIEQAEKAFGMFFEAANKSVSAIPSPGTELSKQALTFT